jgi:subtilase family serine protease
MVRATICALLMATTGVLAAAQTPAMQTAEPAKINVPVRITRAVDDADRVVLHGGVHRLARPEFDRGAADDSLPANRMLLVLHRSDDQEAALRQLLDQQQSRGSSGYHAWLTPDQFGKQFGPADQDIQTVTSWLQSRGFQVSRVAAGKMFIEFTGTIGQVRNAFHTDIHKFVVDGAEHNANVNDPQIPTALAPVVAGVTSLHNFPRRSLIHRTGVYQRSKDTGEVKPMFTVSGSPISYAIGPADFAKIYNVPATINGTPAGTGQTIAVVNDSNINLADVTAYRTLFGLPANNPTIVLDGPDPGVLSGTTGDEGEAVLDVELAGAIAPNATIDLVISESSQTLGASGVDLSALYIVDNNIAPVMTESFGDCEPTGGDTFYSELWEQAAAQGITVTTATGDSGSAACDGGSGSTETAAASGLAVSGIAATAFNVAVGGTDFNDAGSQTTYFAAASANNSTTLESALSYIPEIPWNDSCAAKGLTGCATVASDGSDLVAAGGGSSNTTPKPSWQTGTGVATSGNRELPDVSLFASDGPKSNSFYAICQADAVTTASDSCVTTGSFEFVGDGGTSASSPAFAAIMALVNQQTGQRQGNANYVLYKLAAQSGASCDSSKTPANGQLTSNACTFYDITTGNNSVACQGGSPNCSNATSGKFGVLVDPSNTSVPAWTTTAGFDKATGLGSMNVSNLLSKWNTVTFHSSTTAITASPTGALAHGADASFTIKVTSGSGTPTGDVALIASPTASTQVGIGSATLDGTGSVTITTEMLPGGADTVTAHYAGDGTFGSSNSTPVPVTVSKEASKTTVGLVTFDANNNILSSNATTAAYGSPYILRVDVTNSAGTQCATSTTLPCPTGTITLTDNGSALKDFGSSNTATLNVLGFLEDQPVQFPAGTQALAASYGGDSSYNASTSGTDTITITTAATSTALTSSASTVATGGSVTLTATITTSSSGVAPTGTVQFLNGTTKLSGTVKYTPTGGSTTGSAGLKATLTSTLTSLAPLGPPAEEQRRFPPAMLLLALCAIVLIAYEWLCSTMPRRRGYAYAGFLLLALLAGGFAGCGGGGGGSTSGSGTGGGTTGGGTTGGGSTGAQSITAVYSGDANYQTSKSTAVSVTIQ